MNHLKPLVIVGDSWGCGEWQLDSDKELIVSHPGMSEYLAETFQVINLSRGGTSNWQSCYILHNWLDHSMPMLSQEPYILVLQTDAARSQQADLFDVDYRQEISQGKNLTSFYRKLIEIFYIKCNNLAERYNIRFYMSGGLADLDLETIILYNNLVPTCPSWIKLLDPSWSHNIIPMRIDLQLFDMAKELKNYDFCDAIMQKSNENVMTLQPLLENKSDYFGPTIGDYHPNRQGHRVFADYIKQHLEKYNA